MLTQQADRYSLLISYSTQGDKAIKIKDWEGLFLGHGLKLESWEILKFEEYIY